MVETPQRADVGGKYRRSAAAEKGQFGVLSWAQHFSQMVAGFARIRALPSFTPNGRNSCESGYKSGFFENGRPAHVAWQYDPLSGEKLPE